MFKLLQDHFRYWIKSRMWKPKEKVDTLVAGGRGGDLNYFDENRWDKQHDSGICKTKNCSWKMLLKEAVSRIKGRGSENFLLLIPTHHS